MADWTDKYRSEVDRLMKMLLDGKRTYAEVAASERPCVTALIWCRLNGASQQGLSVALEEDQATVSRVLAGKRACGASLRSAFRRECKIPEHLWDK